MVSQFNRSELSGVFNNPRDIRQFELLVEAINQLQADIENVKCQLEDTTGGASGVSDLDSLSDVNAPNPLNDYVLKYMAPKKQWEPAPSKTYNPASYTKQTDSTYIYFAWTRIDGTGYLAKRRLLSTGEAAGSNTGALPMPADLTALSYT